MMNRLRSRRPLVLPACACAALALACAALPAISEAAGFDAARPGVSQEVLPGNGNGNGNGGNGNGNGNGGNGNGGNGNGGNRPGGGNVSAQVQPDVWNTNYDRAEGTVTVVIRGRNLGDIDLDSIVLVGTDPAEGPVEPLRVRRQGPQIRAFFAKDDALASLDTPKRGEAHEVTIQFTRGEDDTEVSLTDTVRIVGPAGGGDGGGEEEVALDLAIQADHWNVNWARSNGTVTALIRGDGLADIDLQSIELVGTDPDAEPLAAVRARRVGNHVRAFFAKDDALATLDTPKSGEVHEITIRLTVAGEETELTDRIRVVGPGR